MQARQDAITRQQRPPVDRAAGRTFEIGGELVTGVVAGFYNVERPDGGPGWNIRAQMGFLFPR